MAGTIVADTIQNGAGTSTSMTNAISGSARAWVNFQGGQGSTAGVINNSYNVSSVTVNGTGDYTVNFTNAMANATYAWSLAAGGASQYSVPGTYDPPTANTTTSIRVINRNLSSSNQNPYSYSVIIFSA